MAKRFTFRLQTVLRLRKQTEDECRRRVAERLREIARTEVDIRQLDAQFGWEIERGREDQRELRMDVMTVRRRRSYMGHLQRCKRSCEQTIGKLQKRLAADQHALAQASKEVKVLEKLRDRQWARQREAEQRAERVEEDGIGQQMFIRGKAVTAG